MTLSLDLAKGIQALGLEADDDRVQRLLRFTDDLMKWNKVYNLTAIRKPEDIVTQHLLDSLSISPYLSGNSVVDVGTGGGFPGVPLAIYHPDKHFTLLDSNVKKTRFLQQMIINHDLANCEVVHTRAESYSVEFDVVVCRAFASLADIVTFAGHMVAPEGKLLAMKGQPEAELQDLSAASTSLVIQEVLPLKVPGLEAARHLVVMGRQ